jgi:thiol-disulfide isomerase/thioredoxin
MTPSRRFGSLLLATLLAGLLVPGTPLAAPMEPFSKEAFARAQNADQPIVVFVHAGWCVTCRRQQPVLERLTKEAEFADVLVLVVDYDKDKATLRELNVTDRSTLVAYRGKTERKRSSFVTDAEAIRALFASVR